jgi:haloacetate dehalogenase
MSRSDEMVDLPGLRMHYRQCGEGPLLVLLHGWPQDSHCWRMAEPLLAGRFRVVSPDLRGYGLTDKPADGYDKRTMAADIAHLVGHLGHRTARLVGHDRGARVAHRLALDHPDLVSHLAVLDVVPTLEMFRAGTPATSRGYWHWLFHLNPDLPELLVQGRIEAYLRWFFERWTVRRDLVEPAVPHYVESFSRPGALRAGFDDYRATFPHDLDHDAVDFEAGRRVEVPLLALWGEHGLPASLPVLEMWGRYATQVEGEAMPDCGHFLPEEQPERLASRLLDFLAD